MRKGKAWRIICVGRLRVPFLCQAQAFYLERIGHFRPLELVECRDGDSALPRPERIRTEGQRQLAALERQDLAVALDEGGEEFSSAGFAAFLRRLDAAGRRPCFLVGGAYGLDGDLRKKTAHVISLSRLTFTHELARVILLEQLYRGECILRGFPYHH